MTLVPYLKLAEYARRYVKVALAGDGGDEFFCGYTRRLTASRILRIRQAVPVGLWNRIVKTGSSLFRNGILNWGFRILHFNSIAEFLAQLQVGLRLDDVASLVNPRPSLVLPPQYLVRNGDISFLSLNNHTVRTYFPDAVLKTSDRASMRHALQARVPFTDYRLVAFASRIPPSIQFKNGTDKYVLKRLLWKYVPRQLVDRPKMGFGLPGRRWLSTNWKLLLEQYFGTERIAQSGVFNVDAMRNLLERYRCGGRGYEGILWRVIIFQIWWERWFRDGASSSSLHSKLNQKPNP